MPGLRWELIPTNEKIDLVKAALSKTNSQLKKPVFRVCIEAPRRIYLD